MLYPGELRELADEVAEEVGAQSLSLYFAPLVSFTPGLDLDHAAFDTVRVFVRPASISHEPVVRNGISSKTASIEVGVAWNVDLDNVGSREYETLLLAEQIAEFLRGTELVGWQCQATDIPDGLVQGVLIEQNRALVVVGSTWRKVS